LIDMGLRPLDAYNAAAPFGLAAHTPKGLPRRLPCQLFDRSKFDTIFVWRRGAPARVIGVPKGGAIPQLDLRLDDEFGEATVTLLLNAVEATVFKKLGFPFSENAISDENAVPAEAGA
jgi:hypothetical protein